MKTLKTYRVTSLFWVALLLEVLFWGLGFWGYNLVKNNNTGFRLESPDMMYGFIALPIITIIYIAYYTWKNKAIKRFADDRLLPHLMPSPHNGKVLLRYILIRLGLGLIIFSLCNPQFGKSKKTGIAKGIDIIIALDISKSMEARDLNKLHSRLDIAKRSITRLLEDGLRGDRVGLVIFAGNAYKQVALSQDYDALKFDLGNINTDMLRVQGTNISAAIDLSLTSFNKDDETNKAIIVVSDGENHEPNAQISAARAYKDNQVKVYTIGLGKPSGARIPRYDENENLIGYLKDDRGNTVLTKLNESMLEDIAEVGNGMYVKGSSTDLGLDDIVEDINTIEKTDFGKKEYIDYNDQFQWFLGPGIILFMMSLLFFGDQRNKRPIINLFDK